MSAVAAQKENFDETAMKAVIVYDDFAFATRAAAMLERAAVPTGESWQWDFKPWRLDILSRLPLAEIADGEAVDANVIVLALAETHWPPAELMAWLEYWATHRQIEDAAVLLLAPASTPLGVQLKQFAAVCGFTFLCEGRDAENPESVLAQPELPLPPASPPVDLPRIPDHWGLND